MLNSTHTTTPLPTSEALEIAAELEGNTAQVVRALIEGVLADPRNHLTDPALAALHAIAYLHVPNLQETADELEALHRAH